MNRLKPRISIILRQGNSSFADMNILTLLETFGITMAKAKIMESIEPLGCTEKEFAYKNKSIFVGDGVKTKGIEIRWANGIGNGKTCGLKEGENKNG